MAVNCTVAATLADPETLEAISLNDREFYGTASDEESFVSHTTARDSDEDEHLSPSEDEEAIERAARGLAGASASQESSQDDEMSAQIAGGCGCSEDCYQQFSPQEILDFKLSMRELSKGERDLFLMGKLQVCIRDSATVTHARSRTATKKQRVSCQYAFDHRLVCQNAFCYIHEIGNFTLRALRKHIGESGPVPRQHGNKGRKAYNAYPFDVILNAVGFIKNYALVFGLPQPAASRGRANAAPTYLPANQNHTIVHQKYREACCEKHEKYMEYRSFLDTWHQCLPQIVFMTPRSDVCKRCEDYRSSVQEAVTEDEKKQKLAEFSQHLEDAQKERDAYLAAIEKAKVSRSPTGDQKFSHLTFDFAQQVFLPYHARQVGPLFFKVPFRVQIFGICNDAVPLQVNYLFNEKESIGINGSKSHGPNTVISMLHHYLAVHSRNEPCLHFHADNCVGQNKNKSVLAYLMWRTLVGLSEEVTLSFLRDGHTRCLVNACFGLLKKRYRASDCDSMQHLKETVEVSAKCNSVQVFQWEWREWDRFLLLTFKPLPGIRQHQHFRFNKDAPGIVFTRKCCDSPEFEHHLLKRGVNVHDFDLSCLPPILPPAGLSHDRAQYLHKEIRPFVKAQFRDELCPSPPGK